MALEHKVIVVTAEKLPITFEGDGELDAELMPNGEVLVSGWIRDDMRGTTMIAAGQWVSVTKQSPVSNPSADRFFARRKS